MQGGVMATTHATRWWIAPPRPDESLRSVVARAADLYRLDVPRLWRALQGSGQAIGDLDDPPARQLCLMAQAMAVPAARLHAHRLPDAPWLLAPEARLASCPRCDEEARVAGKAPIYRRSWARVLSTSCGEHAVPLRRSVSVLSPGDRGFKLPLPESEDALALLGMIERFGITLDGCLYFGKPWPSEWKGTPALARAGLLRACCNLDSQAQWVPIDDVQPLATLLLDIHGSRHRCSPTHHGVGWEGFRRIATPALRRAALWLVAWECIPNLPSEFWPGTSRQFGSLLTPLPRKLPRPPKSAGRR
jgi:hypothetical protein